MVGGYGILAVVTLFFKYSGYEGCVEGVSKLPI